MNFHFSPVI